MNGEYKQKSLRSAEKNLLELLALGAPQAEWLIKQLVSGIITMDEAEQEMHELSDTQSTAYKH